MSQKYIVVAKMNPINKNADPKYYAQAKSNMKVSVKDICTRIAERSSYPKGELEGTINEFLLETEHVLGEGNIAQLGELGNFRMSIRTADATETAEAFGKANIKDCKIIFWPGASLRKLCKTMDYVLYKPDVVEKEPVGSVD
ncbi:MAG: DNA-binding protein [Bacteroides sp.]|nr:DNA-binding protein [Bacteroides sp.]